MPVLAMIRAKHDFIGTESEELSFKSGELIYLLHKDESGWAKGRKSNGEKGWFPLNYTEVVIDVDSVEEKPPTEPKPLPLNKISLQEEGRFRIVSEIVSTERTYHKNLVCICTSWLVPLRKENIIDSKFLPKIFCNIEDILTVSTKFLGETESAVEKWSESPMIGNIFLATLPEFSCYEAYLMNHHNAILLINQFTKEKKSFASWMQSVKEGKECEGLDLLAFLIMPVQRILRYKLLLEELKKNTLSDHPDYNNLVESLAKIAAIASNVNESIKEEENFQTLCRIQKSFVGNVKNIVIDNRKFIREGPVTKICRKTAKPRWFFLFSDALVYASIASSSNRKSNSPSFRGTNNTSKPLNRPAISDEMKYVFHRMVSMGSTSVKSIEDTSTLKNAFQVLTTSEKSFIVYTDKPEEKEAWLQDFTSLANGALENSAPVWQQDSDVKACVLCNKSFNVVQRRHHCRYCGKVVCGSCSSQRVKIPQISPQPVRVCRSCYDEMKDDVSRNSFLKDDVSRNSYSSAPSTPSGSVREKKKISDFISEEQSPEMSPKVSPRTSMPILKTTGTPISLSPDNLQSINSAPNNPQSINSAPNNPQSINSAPNNPPSQKSVEGTTGSLQRPASGPPPKPSYANKPPVLPPKGSMRSAVSPLSEIEELKKRVDEMIELLSQEVTAREDTEKRLLEIIEQQREDIKKLKEIVFAK